jgi:hypothetical protein
MEGRCVPSAIIEAPHAYASSTPCVANNTPLRAGTVLVNLQEGSTAYNQALKAKRHGLTDASLIFSSAPGEPLLGGVSRFPVEVHPVSQRESTYGGASHEVRYLQVMVARDGSQIYAQEGVDSTDAELQFLPKVTKGKGQSTKREAVFIRFTLNVCPRGTG